MLRLTWQKGCFRASERWRRNGEIQLVVHMLYEAAENADLRMQISRGPWQGGRKTQHRSAKLAATMDQLLAQQRFPSQAQQACRANRSACSSRAFLLALPWLRCKQSWPSWCKLDPVFALAPDFMGFVLSPGRLAVFEPCVLFQLRHAQPSRDPFPASFHAKRNGSLRHMPIL